MTSLKQSQRDIIGIYCILNILYMLNSRLDISEEIIKKLDLKSVSQIERDK